MYIPTGGIRDSACCSVVTPSQDNRFRVHIHAIGSQSREWRQEQLLVPTARYTPQACMRLQNAGVAYAMPQTCQACNQANKYDGKCDCRSRNGNSGRGRGNGTLLPIVFMVQIDSSVLDVPRSPDSFASCNQHIPLRSPLFSRLRVSARLTDISPLTSFPLSPANRTTMTTGSQTLRVKYPAH